MQGSEHIYEDACAHAVAQVLDTVTKRVHDLAPPQLVTNFRILSAHDVPASAADETVSMQNILATPATAGSFEAWALIIGGLKHMKEGAPGAKPGMITTALTKASMRSSSLAASLGIMPPRYEFRPYEVRYKDGREQGLGQCAYMVYTLAEDAEKSDQLIKKSLRTQTLIPAFVAQSSDQELKKYFSDVREKSGISPPDIVNKNDVRALRDQLWMWAETLSCAYTDACEELHYVVASFFPANNRPEPSPRGRKSKGLNFN
jgi:hypothetical protein